MECWLWQTETNINCCEEKGCWWFAIQKGWFEKCFCKLRIAFFTVRLLLCCRLSARFFVWAGKGQLISKANSTVFNWTKKRTKFFFYFCPDKIVLSWVRAPLKEIFSFLKSDLKWAFSEILIHFLMLEFDICRTIFIFCLYWFCEILISITVSKFDCMKCS